MSRARPIMNKPTGTLEARRHLFLDRIHNRHRKLIHRITSILTMENEAVLTEDQARTCAHFIYTEIRRIEKLNTGGKMETFIDLSQVFDYVFNRDTLEAQMWWVLKRYKLFKRMSLAIQSRYLTELIDWRNIIGKHDGLYLAYFLPGIHIFDQVASEDRAPADTDKNWFVWWYTSRRYGLLRVDCNRTQRVLDEDRMLLDKLRPRILSK